MLNSHQNLFQKTPLDTIKMILEYHPDLKIQPINAQEYIVKTLPDHNQHPQFEIKFDNTKYQIQIELLQNYHLNNSDYQKFSPGTWQKIANRVTNYQFTFDPKTKTYKYQGDWINESYFQQDLNDTVELVVNLFGMTNLLPLIYQFKN